LRPGSTVAVVAPAGGFDREELFRGLAWLRTRYCLRIAADLLTREGYLAGTDARRARELAAAMTDHEVDAIVCARGGYGAMRILENLPWGAFAARPKWIAGFSDITALHVVANAAGIATIHGPNVTGLGRSIGAAERMSLLAALEGLAPAPWTELRMVGQKFSRAATPPGAACVSGPIVGGNLALVAATAAAGRLEIPKGSILAPEDVSERPYRVDRMLTSLALGGHLARASAIVFGGFTACDPGPDGVLVEDVLRERTGDLGIPVLFDAPFGHGAPNHAFVLGARATIDMTSDTATLRFER
jgi:muramoyltetrapeptide carboxypeptidase